MGSCAGIRREDKSKWERRTPLTPSHVKELIDGHGIHFIVQPSRIRVFKDSEYEATGAVVQEELSQCKTIFAVKEIPIDLLQPGRTYVFFAHVVKGQAHNMPMLARLMELNCSLIDYEKVVDTSGRRLIFFGRHAGLAGAVETLRALGDRLRHEGIESPFTDIKHAFEYTDLHAIEQSVKEVGEKISGGKLPPTLAPLVIGIAGYGNVGKGAMHIIDLLPHVEVSASELPGLFSESVTRKDIIYKVVFKEEDTVEPISAEREFELKDYFAHPEKYKGRFETYLPYLTALVNAVYWEKRYPRLVTKQALKNLFESTEGPRLRVIGDISCDMEGSIEPTVRATNPGSPCYVYDPTSDTTRDGHEGNGIVIMAVDNLPCEIPDESSVYFSTILKEFVPTIVKADYSKRFDSLNLPPEIKRAVILHQGRLAPDYSYLKEFLEKN